jgi:hypothetical protein
MLKGGRDVPNPLQIGKFGLQRHQQYVRRARIEICLQFPGHGGRVADCREFTRL